MESYYTHTLRTLRHDLQPHEYDDLIDNAEALITHASMQSAEFDGEGVSRLITFTDHPLVSQAIWKAPKRPGEFHQDTLGINFVQDALVIGIHPRDTHDLTRNVVIGPHYARYNEYSVTRAGGYERGLDTEHVERFTEHFDAMVARLGLSRITRLARQATANISESAA